MADARILSVNPFKGEVKYQYQWQGRHYTGVRSGLETGIFKDGDTIIKRLHSITYAKTPVPCRIDPSNPSYAILFLPEVRSRIAITRAIFSVFFLSGGLMAMAQAFALGSGRKRLAIHAEKPWLARKAWATSSIQSEEKNKYGRTAVSAVTCLIFMSVMLWLILSDASNKGRLGFLFSLLMVFLFFLIGFFWVGQAVLQYIRYNRFGKVGFDLAPFPGRIGGEVGGNIRITAKLDPTVVPEIRLACRRVIVMQGGESASEQREAFLSYVKNQGRIYQTLWSSEVSHPIIQSQGNECAIIPVHFQVPGDLPSSSVERSADGDVIWELSVRAKISGPDLIATFDIPVFGN